MVDGDDDHDDQARSKARTLPQSDDGTKIRSSLPVDTAAAYHPSIAIFHPDVSACERMVGGKDWKRPVTCRCAELPITSSSKAPALQVLNS